MASIDKSYPLCKGATSSASVAASVINRFPSAYDCISIYFSC